MSELPLISGLDVVGTIDHAILGPTITHADVANGIAAVLHLPLASVCVNSVYVNHAVSCLAGAGIAVCSVVGFPSGSVALDAKLRETEIALDNGAVEIDMVLHLGAALGGHISTVRTELRFVTALVHQANCKLKVILETGLLSDALIAELCSLCSDEGADFVKTSTGFGTVHGHDGHLVVTGATIHHVALMARCVSARTAVKASGGIRTLTDARAMLQAGATRLGTSSTLAILADEKSLTNDY